MRFFRKIFRPEYFFVLSIVSFFAFVTLFLLNFREQISSYHTFSWSPDGTKLAFIAEEDNTLQEIFVIDADGRNPVNLTTQISDYNRNTELRWSANNETLYYSIAHYSSSVRYTITWHRIRLKSNQFSFNIFGQRGTLDYPLASQELIDSSSETGSASDIYYARSVCNNESRFVNCCMDECEKTLEVYSVETDELLWSFGEQRYNWTRRGILSYGYPTILFVLLFIVTPASFGLSIILLIVNLLGKPDNRKRKEKSSQTLSGN